MSTDDCLDVPDLEKLPKGSECEGKQDVPARSDYWRSDTDSVRRCSSFDTGRGKESKETDDSGGEGDSVFDAYPDQRIMRQTVYEVFDALLPSQVINDFQDAFGTTRSMAGATFGQVKSETDASSQAVKQLYGTTTPENGDDQTIAHAQQKRNLGPFAEDVEPMDALDTVNGWHLERERYDQVDYTAEWYEGLPIAEMTDTEPHEIEEAMVTVRYTGNAKYPKRWTARILHWNDNGRNIRDTDFDSWWSHDTNVENRNAALQNAVDWMQDHDVTDPPAPPEPDDEDDTDEDSEGHGNYPAFSITTANGRLREVLEPFDRFTAHTDHDAHFTVDDEGAIDFVGVNADNTVMYRTSLLLSSADSATVEAEGGTVKFPPEALAGAVSETNMSEVATLEARDGELIYEGSQGERSWNLDDTSIGMPDLPDLDKDGPGVENVPANLLQNRVRGLSKIQDGSGYDFASVFVVRPDEAYFVAENNGNRARARLSDDADDIWQPHGDWTATLFTTDYLRQVSLSPYSPSSTDVTIRLYKSADLQKERFYDSPMRVRYEQKGGFVEYTVAPRVSSEDSDPGTWDLSAPPCHEPVSYDLAEPDCPAAGVETDEWELREPLQTGEPVPDAVNEHMDTEGDTVIWTFPNSDGCRCGTQAKNYDTLASEYGVSVYGIADTDPEDLQEMAETLDLNAITLVSDQEGTFTDALGVERTDAGFERKTFFVRDGRVTDVSDGVMEPNLAQPIHPDDEDEPAQGCLTSLNEASSDPGEFHVGPREYIHGDIDGDDVPNVDDRNPFKANPDDSFYAELSLSDDVLRKAEAISENHRQVFHEVVEEFGADKARVKHPISILEKLLRKHAGDLTDIVGVTVYEENHQEILDRADWLNENFEVVKQKDYIRDPKNDVYYAYHAVFEWTGRGSEDTDGAAEVELQLKTPAEAKLQAEMHEAYKQGKDLDTFERKAKKLAAKYGTDATAVDNDAERDPRPVPEVDDALSCPFDRYPDVDLDDHDEWTLAQASSADTINAPKHPGIYVITGQRGAGKSALAMQTAEKMSDEHGVQPVTVGMPVQAREHFPDDWQHVRHVHDAPGDSVLVVDEAYMSYHSRESMSEENKNLGKLINTSRHCGNSMLFVSQNSSYIEKNTVSEADAILAKEPGKMQMQFERMQIRSISKEAKEQFNALPEDVDNRAYVYMYGDEHTGMLQNDMPDWYNEEISKSFRALCKNRENENENADESENEDETDEATEKAQQAAENAL